MRSSSRTIDDGAWEAVAALNRIPGVMTRGSCQGAGPPLARHRHADLAYVVFRHPLPLRLQAFLIGRLDTLARIEDDGIYSRWPDDNRRFLDSLAASARAFLEQEQGQPCQRLRRTLPKLRAQVARALAYRRDTILALCLDCTDLVSESHPRAHRSLPLVRLGANQEASWFAEFVGQPGNALDPALIAADGWDRLVKRSACGDFGAAFHRRWLRYRTGRIADMTTRQLRRAAQDARHQGSDLDFFYDDAQAVFAWPCE